MLVCDFGAPAAADDVHHSQGASATRAGVSSRVRGLTELQMAAGGLARRFVFDSRHKRVLSLVPSKGSNS